MIDLKDVIEYCTSKRVIDLAKYADNEIILGNYTIAFGCSEGKGVLFEDRNEERYIELNIEEQDKDVIEMYIYYEDSNGNSGTIYADTIDEAINLWNDLF